MNTFLRYLFTCLVALPLLTGCDFDLGGEDRPLNHCTSNADCAAGVCDPEEGICCSVSVEPLPVLLAITPNRDEMPGMPLTTVTEFTAQGNVTLDLPVETPVLVQGTVFAADGETPISATLDFEPLNREYGDSVLDRVANATTIRGQTGRLIDAHFMVRLPGNSQYRVHVTPTGEDALQHAPMVREISVPEADPAGLAISPLPIIFPAANSYQDFWGKVIVGEDETSYLGVGGLSVRAVNPTTGLTLSNMAITSSEESNLGQFRLRIPAGVTEYHLRVGTRAEPDPQHTVLIDPRYLHSAEDEPVRVLIQPPEVITFEGTVETDGDNPRPVGQAHITFYARSLTHEGEAVLGTSRVTTETDSDGVFRAELREGEYTILITPPAREDLSVGIAQQTVRAAESGERRLLGQLFLLSALTEVEGRLSSFDNSRVPAATVEARARDIAGLVDRLSGVMHHRTNSATSTVDGDFTLPLDQGSYDLFAYPSPGSGLPWLVAPGLEVNDERNLADRLDLDFAPPVMVRGVVSAASSIVPNAEIRAYSMVRNESGDLRPVQIGRTSSDQDGNYVLLLPPYLSQAQAD